MVSTFVRPFAAASLLATLIASRNEQTTPLWQLVPAWRPSMVVVTLRFLLVGGKETFGCRVASATMTPKRPSALKREAVAAMTVLLVESVVTTAVLWRIPL